MQEHAHSPECRLACEATHGALHDIIRYVDTTLVARKATTRRTRRFLSSSSFYRVPAAAAAAAAGSVSVKP